jgi:SpoIIAA-like
VVEEIGDMPDGTIGFRPVGPVTRADWDEILLPAIREAHEEGIRLLLEIPDHLDRERASETWHEVRHGVDLGELREAPWERIALVTDHVWVNTAAFLLGWMVPGQLRVLDDLEEAKEWLAE